MNRQPFSLKAKRWDARLSPFWARLTRPLRRGEQRQQRLVEVQVRGLERLRTAVEEGAGVLITPNHPGHADCYAMMAASDQLGGPFYFMTAWQVFNKANWFNRLVYQVNGCFSIEREGSDLWAFRRAVGILAQEKHPLIIFPEGDVYHLNDRVTPLREGTAMIALTALKHTRRPILIFPCGLKYQYVRDPIPELEGVMAELEAWLHWRPQTGIALDQRIYKFAEAMLGMKEVEYLDHPSSGPLPGRVERLREHVLGGLESNYGFAVRNLTFPERVKNVRRACLERLDAVSGDPVLEDGINRQLDDVFFVVQLFSYPGDYVAERPTLERMAETIDKFEEDLLGLPTARIRGVRRAWVEFGEPIDVRQLAGADQQRKAGRTLTDLIERSIQQLLEGDGGEDYVINPQSF